MPVVALIYPPGLLFQRGEDRCQSNIASSTATSMRACNDLGYAAAALKQKGFDVFLKDYQTEGLTFDDLLSDLEQNPPDMLMMSTTNATIFTDLEIVKRLKAAFDKICVVLKGAVFFDPEDGLLNQLDLSLTDYLIGGESDFIIGDLAWAHFNDQSKLSAIGGILYRENGQWKRTDFAHWHEDLDALPFPDRSLMNNALYLRPDTQEKQATIATSRGCPSNCIFCLTPHISGKRLRLRSPENIFAEITECYEKFGIRNFFFKSDTFTINKAWTVALCDLILSSPLKGKIEWVANSRVNPIDQETLVKMKQAGCWLVAFGFESGSSDTLEKARKGATVEQNKAAAEMAKKAGLMVYGFYLIGFPWETQEHLEATRKLIFDIDADFIELHIATPFYGTGLYEMAKEAGLIDESVLGKDYFNAPTIGTKYLSIGEIEAFRKKTILKYHLRPSYILRKLKYAVFRPKVLKNYFVFGLKLIKNTITR
ncbi:MAG: radical SAM protein [Alphaproteobacteria bacterium]|nr:radical SAM protein [Alphaproteobacteria bacterium]